MKKILKLKECNLKQRRVFVRADFNVPLAQKGSNYQVTDDTRIVGALPTIQRIIEEGGKCILASHLGRPDGKKNQKYSLEPVAQRLSELLRKDVVLTDNCIGDGPRGVISQMRWGDVLLLENLRFHPGEETNSPEFAASMAALCDVYVGDGFGTLHRAHASTSGLPKMMAEKCVGLLVERELAFLEPLRDNPKRPFVLVMGGAKVSDKIGVIEHFLSRVDRILLGGAMAYAFLKAQGIEIGKSYCDDKQVTLAARLLKEAELKGVEVILPIDHMVTTGLEDRQAGELVEEASIPKHLMGVDIGPKSVALFKKALEGAETVFWNGPVGVFETPQFATGTYELAKVISQSKARKLVGGGDVVAAIAGAGCSDRFDFISTGGGATLEYLEGKDLPGLTALEITTRPDGLRSS